jgi:sugar phosphate isomerase/epimerase
MYYTGFADEAGNSLDVQIKATLELGWQQIESRSIDGVNLTDISDEQFEIACQKLDAAGVKINCFGSAIANWSTDPRKEEDFQASLASLRRAIPRMQRLGTRYLRGMSFGIVRDAVPDSPEIEKLVFEKVRTLVALCEEAGVYFLQENCMNYGGLSYEHTLRLLDAVRSPYFKLVFDTGNPVGSDSRIGKPPYHKQSSWEFYCNVREFIEYVHIKDCIFIEETGWIFPKLQHTFPGEGHGDVRQIVADLLQRGYNGGFSIEPHLGAVYHDASLTSPEQIRYANYTEYGRRFMGLVRECQKNA